MGLVVDNQKMTFREVFQHLRERIAARELTGQVPSLAELQQQYGVSSNTVKKALSLLKEQRFVRGFQGKGIFVNTDNEINALAQKNVALFIQSETTNPLVLEMIYEIRLQLESERCNAVLLNSLSQLKAFTPQLDVLILLEQFDGKVPNELQSIDPGKIICCNCRQLSGCCWVGSDNWGGGYMAAEFLYRSGCRRVGVLGDYDIEDASGYLWMRRKGVAQFAAEHSDWSWTRSEYGGTETQRPRSFAPIERLFHDGPLDGIFLLLDILVFRVCDYCRRHGIEIGRDVQLIGFDDSAFCGELDPPLTSIREDAPGIALAAVGMVRRILCRAATVERIAVPPVIIDRRQN